MGFDWTDEIIERAKTLWLSGKSASEVAEAIGHDSRSAVSAKMNRLGLQKLSGKRRVYNGRPAKDVTSFNRGNFKDTSVPGATRERADGAPPRPKADAGFNLYRFATVDDVIRKGILDLEANDCRYFIGDPKQPFPKAGFCAQPKMPGSAYCPGHFRRCSEPTYFQQRAKAIVDASVDKSLKLPAPANT